MCANHKVEFINQKPQQNGYWLIELNVYDTPLAPGDHFHLAQHALQAWLFSTKGHSSQWLSHIPWPQDLNTTSLNIQSYSVTIDWQRPQCWRVSGLAQAAVFACAQQRQQHQIDTPMIALLHSREAFPFKPQPARFMLEFAAEAIGACPLLEDWGVAHRLASNQALVGCLQSTFDQIPQHWTPSLTTQDWQIHNLTDLL